MTLYIVSLWKKTHKNKYFYITIKQEREREGVGSNERQWDNMVLENLKMAFYHSLYNIYIMLVAVRLKDQILRRVLWRTTYNLELRELLLVLWRVASSECSIQLDLEEVLSSVRQVICMAVGKKIGNKIRSPFFLCIQWLTLFEFPAKSMLKFTNRHFWLIYKPVQLKSFQ